MSVTLRNKSTYRHAFFADHNVCLIIYIVITIHLSKTADTAHGRSTFEQSVSKMSAQSSLMWLILWKSWWGLSWHRGVTLLFPINFSRNFFFFSQHTLLSMGGEMLHPSITLLTNNKQTNKKTVARTTTTSQNFLFN